MRWGIYWQLEARVLGFTVDPRLMRQVEKIARSYIARKIRDPELRAKVTPSYMVGCKRVLISSDYYPALTQPNVDVITDGIREIRPHSVVDATGREREVDAIVYGTGFKVQDFVPRGMFFGRGGRDLGEIWREGPEGYKGTTVSGFPNLFFLTGPNTGLGHSSMVFIIESQVAYVIDALRQMEARRWSTVEVTPEAQAAFNEGIQAKSQKAVWSSGCTSWYLSRNGRNTTLWPDFTFRFRKATREFDAAAYRTERVADQTRGPHGTVAHAESISTELR
jgi:cyclohexanone monooxygenase